MQVIAAASLSGRLSVEHLTKIATQFIEEEQLSLFLDAKESLFKRVFYVNVELINQKLSIAIDQFLDIYNGGPIDRNELQNCVASARYNMYRTTCSVMYKPMLGTSASQANKDHGEDIIALAIFQILGHEVFRADYIAISDQYVETLRSLPAN